MQQRHVDRCGRIDYGLDSAEMGSNGLGVENLIRMVVRHWVARESRGYIQLIDKLNCLGRSEPKGVSCTSCDIISPTSPNRALVSSIYTWQRYHDRI